MIAEMIVAITTVSKTRIADWRLPTKIAPRLFDQNGYRIIVVIVCQLFVSVEVSSNRFGSVNRMGNGIV
jgi:hypothetical protein